MIDSTKNTRVSITLNKDILKKLDKIAEETSRNRSKMLEYLIKNYKEK